MTKESQEEYKNFCLNNKLTYEDLTKLTLGDGLVNIADGWLQRYHYGGQHPIHENYSLLISQDNVENVRVVYKSFVGDYYKCNDFVEELFAEKLIIENKLSKLNTLHDEIDIEISNKELK